MWCALSMESFCILSWNVTSWRTTLDHIREHHKSAEKWLRGHGADVLALQEVKTNDKHLEQQPRIFAIDGFDAFFACNTTQERAGFDGVATFARRGLVVAADRRPLGNPELDHEGRCLRTDLRVPLPAPNCERYCGIALFNVYVPTSSRPRFKLLFLRALRDAMGRARAQGWHVVLVGDLNITRRSIDCHWSVRTVDIAGAMSALGQTREKATTGGAETQMCAARGAEREAGAAAQPQNAEPQEQQEEDQQLFRLLWHVRRCWPAMRRALSRRRVRQEIVSNSATGQRLPRWRVKVPVAGSTDGRGDDSGDVGGSSRRANCAEIWATLGPTHMSEQSAAAAYDYSCLCSVAESESGSTPGESGATIAVQWSVTELRDALKVICDVQWSERDARMIADAFGRSPSHVRWLQWLETLLRGTPETDESEQDATFCDAADANEQALPGVTAARHVPRAHEQPAAEIRLGRQLHTPMVDVFAALHGAAQGRYTCWNQYKNQRYSNVGARIDYTIVDSALFGSVVRPGEARLSGLPPLATIARPLALPDVAHASEGDPCSPSPYSEAAAHLAATAGGRWQPAAFSGVGLEQGREDWYSLQFVPPHNGMVYCPPRYSDHIAVSLLLDMRRAPAHSPNAMPAVDLNGNSRTKECQPHLRQPDLRSVFMRAGSVLNSSLGSKLQAAARNFDAHGASIVGDGSSSATRGTKRARRASAHPLRDAFSKGRQQPQRVSSSSSDTATSAAAGAGTNCATARAQVRAECNRMGLELSDTAVGAAVARASTVQGALNMLLDQSSDVSGGDIGAARNQNRSMHSGGLAKWLGARNNKRERSSET